MEAGDPLWRPLTVDAERMSVCVCSYYDNVSHYIVQIQLNPWHVNQNQTLRTVKKHIFDSDDSVNEDPSQRVHVGQVMEQIAVR